MKSKFLCIGLLAILVGCARTQRSTQPDSLDGAPAVESGEAGGEPTIGEEVGQEEPVAPALPVSDSSYTALGKVMRSRSEDSVIQEASKILAKNPKDLKALNALAVHYIVNRKLEMAKVILARAIKSHPNDPSLVCNLGIVNLLEDNLAEAIIEFQKALSFDQGHAEASYHLGAIHARFKNAPAAVPLLRRAYSKLPKNLVGPHYAEALRLGREPKEALKVYEDLKTDTSRDVALVLGFASLLVEEIKDKKRGLKMVDRIRLLTEDAAILKRADDLASIGAALR